MTFCGCNRHGVFHPKTAWLYLTSKACRLDLLRFQIDEPFLFATFCFSRALRGRYQPRALHRLRAGDDHSLRTRASFRHIGFATLRVFGFLPNSGRRDGRWKFSVGPRSSYTFHGTVVSRGYGQPFRGLRSLELLCTIKVIYLFARHNLPLGLRRSI